MATPRHQMLHISECLSLPARLTTQKIVHFLDEKSLFALTWTCKDYRNQYKDLHADKKIAAEMLRCVLNPTQSNQELFIKLLSVQKQHLTSLPLYLIPNNGEEYYLNIAKKKKTKTKRQHVSVLEAVLRTGNFHLAIALFNNIPITEKTKNLKKQIAEIKSKGIWGTLELKAAYKNFFDSWETLFYAEKLDELDRLSGLICHSQKAHLPWFFLYPLPPNCVCRPWDNCELDLDIFGGTRIHALYKDGRWSSQSLHYTRGFSSALDTRCKLLSSELDNTIKQFGLDEPELKACALPGP